MLATLKTGAAALAIAVTLASNAFAAGYDVNVTSTDLALRGVDPVSYFTDGEPLEGLVDITSEHNGAVYRFVSEESKAMFEANPEKFAPQYGGYCAFGLANGYKFDGDPDLWAIVDDKLYLNLSPAVQERWSSDTTGFINMAEDLWDGVKDVAPGELNP